MPRTRTRLSTPKTSVSVTLTAHRMAADIGLQHDLAIGMVVEAALMAARSGTSFSDALVIVRATYC